MNRRKLLVLATAGIVLACWYLFESEGDPSSAQSVLIAPLKEAPAWDAPPTLLQNLNEPTAVYLAYGLQGPDGSFPALRIDATSGARSAVRIRFGPDTAFIPFVSAENSGNPAVEFRGITFGRPTPHLFRFPGTGGPGLHLVDSATGSMRIAAGTGNDRRTVLTLPLVNSSRMPEIRSHLWSDKARRLGAFFWRKDGIWTLYLFPMRST
jgi:hypothetical protein